MDKKSKLLIDEPPIQVLPTLAKKIGLNEAIVLQQIHYWMNNSKSGEYYNGYKWIYNTYEKWREDNFPFWSERTIQRIIQSLEASKLVVSSQIKKGDYNRVKFYRIDYKKLNELEGLDMPDCHEQECQDDIDDNANMASSLTETTSENTTEKYITPQNDDTIFTLEDGTVIEKENSKKKNISKRIKKDYSARQRNVIEKDIPPETEGHKKILGIYGRATFNDSKQLDTMNFCIREYGLDKTLGYIDWCKKKDMSWANAMKESRAKPTVRDWNLNTSNGYSKPQERKLTFEEESAMSELMIARSRGFETIAEYEAYMAKFEKKKV